MNENRKFNAHILIQIAFDNAQVISIYAYHCYFLCKLILAH